MRMILEKAEIVRIVGEHFGSELDPESVVIRTDPFEVEISGIPLPAAEPPAPKNEAEVVRLPTNKQSYRYENDMRARMRADENALAEPPPVDEDEMERGSDQVTVHDVAEQSKRLEAELLERNPQLARRTGGQSEAPPYDPSEIS